MAGVVALLILVSGSVLVMGVIAIVWFLVFAALHLAGVMVRPVRAHADARMVRAKHRRIDSAEVPVVPPEKAAA